MDHFISFMRENWGWIASFGGFLVAIFAYVNVRLKAVSNGLQALLRAQMINDYNHYSEKEYAPIYARQNFQNCWEQYHALGANGVMDDIRNKFLALPTNRG